MFNYLKAALVDLFRSARSGRGDGVKPTVNHSATDQATRNFGYLVVAVVFLGFGGWAVLAPLESAVIGMGSVQVKGNRKPVQHLEGGIVSRIFVENGDYVLEGQPLLQLDVTQARFERRIVEGRIWAKEAALSRLLSERDGLDDIQFLGSVAQSNDPRAVTTKDSEAVLFAARRADRLGEIAVARQRLVQLEEKIVGSESVLEAKGRIAESLDSEIADLQSLLAEGYVDKQRILQLERSLSQTLGEVSDLKAQIAASIVGVEEAKLTILQIEKRFVTQVVNELTNEQDELFDLQQRLEILVDVVSRATVRSPASGYILSLKPKSAGAVIGSGEEVAAVVPDLEKLIINAQLSPMDIDRLSIGQSAEVRFSIFKDAYTITGTLVKLSADSLTDQSTGEDYFEATVDLYNEDLELLGENQLVPGMPAEVIIKTGDRTLIGYLTSPLQRMFERSLRED